MMRNIKISSRLLLLITAQVLILLMIGGAGYLSMSSAGQTQDVLREIIKVQSQVNFLQDNVETHLVDIISDLDTGRSTWEATRTALPMARAEFDRNWRGYLESLSSDDAELARDVYGPSLLDIQRAFDELGTIVETRDQSRLNLFLTNDFNELVEPYFNALQGFARLGDIESQQALTSARKSSNFFLYASLAVFVIGLLIAGLLGTLIYRSISQPVAQIADTVHKVAAGELEVRSGVTGKDELGELGQAFDKLLQDKMTSLAEAEAENDRLNDSIIALLQAVSQLSQKDLTVRVPVSEDVTGPVADALNLLANETARVLQRVTHIAEAVAAASNKVKVQSDSVTAVAGTEHEQIIRTSSELTAASEAMNEIAELARGCNAAADNAIEQTRTALETVTSTVTGINSTRDTIRETEKRIKRLGERSQEISGVVNLINNIAERTHILALNASMHAASAGEAGRGFAVVADEVQRLAENARAATSQIADLVSNIQAETADTLTTMNATITQVVEGSRLAEQAGYRMSETQSTTAELVQAVREIASSSQIQAQITNELRKRARQIEESTTETQVQLREQTRQTDNLLVFSKGLVDTVKVFRLPSPEKQESAVNEGSLRVVQG